MTPRPVAAAVPLPFAPPEALPNPTVGQPGLVRTARSAARLAPDAASPSIARTARATSSSRTSSSASRTTSSGATTRKASTTASTRSTSKATSSTTRTSLPAELSFLRDPKLSIEEKVFRFLQYFAKKSDDELAKKMEAMGGAAASASKTSSSGSSGSTKKKSFLGSVFEAVKTVVPAVGIAADLLQDKGVQSILKQVGGPVLAAGATVLGFPEVAPVLLKVGPQLVDGAVSIAKELDGASSVSGTRSTSSTSSSSSTGSSGASGGMSEQLQLMELQRAIEKQKEMMTTLSNVLRSMHDMKMNAIQNIR